jgi:hypothetical protein
MGLLFVGGVMDLAWVAVITPSILLEKLLPGGEWIARIRWWSNDCGRNLLGQFVNALCVIFGSGACRDRLSLCLGQRPVALDCSWACKASMGPHLMVTQNPLFIQAHYQTEA